MEGKRRFWPFLPVIPLVIASIAGCFVLPDSLVMQIGGFFVLAVAVIVTIITFMWNL